MQPARPLDNRAARLKAELEAELARIDRVRGLVASLRAELDANPSLREDIAAELQLLVSGDTADAGGDDPDGEDEELDQEAGLFGESLGETLTDRMIHWLGSRGNRPATVGEIARVVGGKPMSVRTILYKADRNQMRFYRTYERDGKTGKYWMLSPVGFGIFTARFADSKTPLPPRGGQ